MPTSVELVEATVALGTKTIIPDCNLQLSPGTAGLLGPNGAGKTTLLRALATILPPVKGHLVVSGQQVESARDARAVRSRIGYLPQHFGYYPSFTAVEFVSYCGWLKGLTARRARKRAREVLDAVGLGDRAGHRMKTLSGGMIQRVGIAQALVSEPDLLLLDEPTAGLDPQQRSDFREFIASLSDVCIVISSHLTDDISAVCDTVLVMDEGQLVYQGSLAGLDAHAGSADRSAASLERGYLQLLGNQRDRAT